MIMRLRRSETGTPHAPASMLALQIVRAAVRPDISIGELVRICENDPAFVIKVLSFVNSAGFAVTSKISSLSHAIALLGVRGTRNLALTSCLGDMTPKGEAGSLLLALCLRRGIAAKRIAQLMGRPNPDDYFAVGLLLEAGILMVAQEDLTRAVEIARLPAASRALVERASVGDDHPRRGAALVRSWGLDGSLAEAVEGHHEPNTPSGELAVVAWMAEKVAAVFEGGDVNTHRRSAIEAAAHLGFGGEEVDRLLREIPEQVQETAEGLQQSVGAQVEFDSLLRDVNAALLDINQHYTTLVARLEALLVEKQRLSEELHAANEKLRVLALFDELTGLANRRSFWESLRSNLALADRRAGPLSLLLFDADHFKQINDGYGHGAGDAVLREIASLIVQSTRVSDVAGRVGGEEFALLLPDTPLEGAAVVAERVRVRLAEREWRFASTALRVTISAGVAAIHGPGCRGKEELLFDAADRALYQAKRQGRNRIHLGALLRPE